MTDSEKDMVERLQQLSNYCFASNCLECEYTYLCDDMLKLMENDNDNIPEYWDAIDIQYLARRLLHEDTES